MAELNINDANIIAASFGLKKNLTDKMTKLVLSLHKAMVSSDSLMIEINPLVITKEGEILALDAKIDFDENAFYRQKDIEELRDEDEEDPLELKAKRHDLNYIKLYGNIESSLTHHGSYGYKGKYGDGFKIKKTKMGRKIKSIK